MATIKAPDPYYCGTLGSITFDRGVAVTDDPRAIAFCRAAGYEVVDEPAEPVPAAAEKSAAGTRAKPE